MEIERKFLLDPAAIPYNLKEHQQTEMVQAYISVDPVIRIRKENERHVLTIKGNGDLAREEHELILEERQFKNLIPLVNVNSTPIQKTRTSIFVEEKIIYEIDVYYNLLEGLATVEVEFPSVSDANRFIPPSWFGRELTYDKSYGNASLSFNGLPKDFLL